MSSFIEAAAESESEKHLHSFSPAKVQETEVRHSENREAFKNPAQSDLVKQRKQLTQNCDAMNRKRQLDSASCTPRSNFAQVSYFS